MHDYGHTQRVKVKQNSIKFFDLFTTFQQHQKIDVGTVAGPPESVAAEQNETMDILFIFIKSGSYKGSCIRELGFYTAFYMLQHRNKIQNLFGLPGENSQQYLPGSH